MTIITKKKKHYTKIQILHELYRFFTVLVLTIDGHNHQVSIYEQMNVAEKTKSEATMATNMGQENNGNSNFILGTS